MSRQTWDDYKEHVRAAVDNDAYFKAHVDALKPAGGNQQALGVCPFHGDKKQSFSVNLVKGVWNCKGCDAHGDVFTFHQRYYNLQGFRAAVLDLGEKNGLPWEGDGEGKKRSSPRRNNSQGNKGKGKDKGKDENQEPELPIYPLPDNAEIQEYHSVLLANEGALNKIIEGRGLTLETIKAFRLGYSEERRRLTIPVYNSSGKLLTVRLYSSKLSQKMISWGPPTHKARQYSSSGHGRTVIYGLPELSSWPVDDDEPVIICEGEFDRLVLVQAGFLAVTHINGAISFTQDFVPLFAGRNVVLCYDADQGGRKGAEKTSALLAPAVKSLKIIDLQTAGLVEGTPESKDISDLARSMPDWPSRLRTAMNEAEPLDISAAKARGPENAPEDDFVKVIEYEDGYWRPRKDSAVPISNFLIHPQRRIRLEDREILEGQILLSGNGRSGTRVVLHPHHWVTKASFKRALGDLGSGYVGTEDELQELKVLLSRQECPKCRGVGKVGLHWTDGKWVLVASDKAITTDSEIDDLVYWSEETTRTQYTMEHIQPAGATDIREAAEALTEFNAPDIVAAVLGWMMAIPFRARVERAIPQLQKQFPLLLLWGERGAGKTKTAELVISPFFGDFSGPRKIDEMTKYTLMLGADATNLIPMVLDEYKPSRMTHRQANEVSSFARSCYNAVTGERGFSQAGERGSKTYTYTAPVVLIGEQTLIEPAIKERVIECTFDKDKRKQAKRHIQDFLSFNMAGVGLSYMRWTMGLTDGEIFDAWRSEHKAADPVFEDRVRQNVSMARLGLAMWKRFLSAEVEYRLNIDPLIEALEESQISALIGEGGRAQNDVDMILNAFSAMAAMRNDWMKEGADWSVSDDRLLIRLQTVYPQFKKWAHDFGFDGEVLDMVSFRKRLQAQPYYIDRQTARFRVSGGTDYSSVPTKAFALDMDKLTAAGIDLTGFGREDPPF